MTRVPIHLILAALSALALSGCYRIIPVSQPREVGVWGYLHGCAGSGRLMCTPPGVPQYESTSDGE
jgi:hypothetical protein